MQVACGRVHHAVKARLKARPQGVADGSSIPPSGGLDRKRKRTFDCFLIQVRRHDRTCGAHAKTFRAPDKRGLRTVKRPATDSTSREDGWATTLLDVRDISLRFGGLKALSEVAFSVEKGELFSIIGPNGAGKTSLLNCISGRYSPSDGRIEFEGGTSPG